MKAKRRSLSEVGREAASAAICTHIDTLFMTLQPVPAPWIVAGFWPLAGEPDLRPGMQRWARQPGWHLALPRVHAPGEPLHFHLWTPDTQLVPGHFGVQEPQGGETVRPTVMLVPGLGFTRYGDRIGYGGGFYDRTLAQLAEQGVPVVKIGVMFAVSEIQADDYRPQPHDQPLDWVVTEHGALRAQPREPV